MSRDTPFGRIATQITPHFVTRQVFCGAGKVGCEQSGREPADVPFQLSQRADFFEEEVGLETTLKRPIVNTRYEPHCDPQKYRRLHVIVGDANMSEVATYLKVGTTAILLAMIEDNESGTSGCSENRCSAIRQVSHDPTLRRTIILRDGRRATALELHWGLLERARKYEQTHGLQPVGEEIGADVLAQVGACAGRAGGQSAGRCRLGRLGRQATARRWLRRPPRPGAWCWPKLKAIDLQYHDLRRRSMPRL